MARGEFTEKTRSLIRQRAGSCCEICGIRTLTGQIHHRQPRGMGGSKAGHISTCANGLYVHPKCHSMIEQNRKRAYQMGWLVASGLQPESTATRLWDGWYLLTADGQRLADSPDE